jgi:hypothetical protein
MAKTSGRLTTLQIQHAKKPGLLADGDGLYLQVASAGARSWIFRFTLNGRTRERGLGSLKGVGLAAARAKAVQCRALLADRIDPIATRDAERAKRVVAGARAITFDQWVGSPTDYEVAIAYCERCSHWWRRRRKHQFAKEELLPRY